MLWILITTFSYLLLAITALVDKYLLSGPPEPKSYVFYINVLGILVLALIPFVGFSLPGSEQIILSFLVGGLTVLGGYCLYTALERFEASRVIPAIGGALPLFTLLISYFFSAGQVNIRPPEFLAFLLLVSGSVLISREKGKAVSWASLNLSFLAAFFFALSFVLVKGLYSQIGFWTTLILTRLGAFLVSLGFLFTREVRREVFQRKFSFKKETGLIFLANQGLGAVALLLQNLAIILVPLSYLAFINALEGIRYVFLLVLVIFVSTKFPRILKEEISKEILFQKTWAILVVMAGLAALVFSPNLKR